MLVPDGTSSGAARSAEKSSSMVGTGLLSKRLRNSFSLATIAA
jgi:hypothetical protein